VVETVPGDKHKKRYEPKRVHTTLSQEALRWAAGLSILIGLAWLPHTSALYVVLCAGSQVEMADADRNHDGYVSMMEAGYACNVESRHVVRKGRHCTEYYNRMDWSQVKLVCDDSLAPRSLLPRSPDWGARAPMLVPARACADRRPGCELS
jgi:hypothetical protein